jgi:hypothetical protein
MLATIQTLRLMVPEDVDAIALAAFQAWALARLRAAEPINFAHRFGGVVVKTLYTQHGGLITNCLLRSATDDKVQDLGSLPTNLDRTTPTNTLPPARPRSAWSG